MAWGCAWGAHGVEMRLPTGELVCESHIRYLVVGTGDNSQVSGACGTAYSVTTSRTGLSDNGAKVIPALAAAAVKAFMASAGIGAAGDAAGLLMGGAGALRGLTPIEEKP